MYYGDRGKLRKYDAELENLGFKYLEMVELEFIQYDIAEYLYMGDDFKSDQNQAEQLENIVLEPNFEKEALLSSPENNEKDH